MRVIIIGAGIGGLACGIRLQSRGVDVTILEKNPLPGGRCGRWESDGYSFDTGPTLLMMPDTLEALFRDAGRKLSDYVALKRINPAYRITFSDGKTLDFTQNMREMEEEIRRFGPGEVSGFYRFLSHAETLYRTSRKHFIDRPLEKPSDYAHGQALGYILKAKPWRSVHDVTRRFFKSPHLQMAFSFQSLYLGISPLDSPSIYGMLSYIDLVDGVYYPEGGMGRLSEALSGLFRELGGTVRFGAEVEEIMVEGGRARGVLLHDERVLTADAVVSNVDLPETYGRFLKNEDNTRARRRVEGMKKGCSAAVFLWGVKQSYPHLRHHNLYLPMAYEKTLGEIFRQGRLPDEPAFYLCAPTRTDLSRAPAGGESLMALVPVPNRASFDDWPAALPRLRQNLLHVLQKTLLPGIASHIETEKVLTPAWYAENYALRDGSTFGFLPTFFQSAMFRPQRRSPDFGGLYFVGAGTHPGNGVPIVLISARLAAEAVLKDSGVPPHVAHPVGKIPTAL